MSGRNVDALLKGRKPDGSLGVVGIDEEGRLLGSGTSTVIPPGGGDPVNLDEEPLVVTLNDGTERVIPTDGLRNRQLVITAVGDASITVSQQFSAGGPWLYAHVVTAASSDDDRQAVVGSAQGGNLYAIRVQRTAGTNATSTAVLS